MPKKRYPWSVSCFRTIEQGKGVYAYQNPLGAMEIGPEFMVNKHSKNDYLITVSFFSPVDFQDLSLRPQGNGDDIPQRGWQSPW